MIPLISIYAGGFLSLSIAVLHTRFYKLFFWKRDFKRISDINAKVLYTIHLALLLLFFMIAAVSIIYAKELSLSMGLSFGLNSLYAIFWLWRFIWQIVYFKREKGAKMSFIGILFTLMFIISAIAYIIPVIYRLL